MEREALETSLSDVLRPKDARRIPASDVNNWEEPHFLPIGQKKWAELQPQSFPGTHQGAEVTG